MSLGPLTESTCAPRSPMDQPASRSSRGATAWCVTASATPISENQSRAARATAGAYSAGVRQRASAGSAATCRTFGARAMPMRNGPSVATVAACPFARRIQVSLVEPRSSTRTEPSAWGSRRHGVARPRLTERARSARRAQSP